VLRFLKIITSVKCVIPGYAGRIVQPEEGKFHRRFPWGVKKVFEKNPPVWSVDIDRDKKGAMKQGLRLLWDSAH
jgi:hypothetical protein